MTTWLVYFMGRERGSHGPTLYVRTTVEGENTNEARLALHERYEYVTSLRTAREDAPVRTQKPGWERFPFAAMEYEAYCPRCFCTRSGSAKEANLVTEACDDDGKCICHDEDQEVQ
jgi:hypothetical protein